METFFRELTSEELDILKSRLSNIRRLVLEFLSKWIFISIFTLIPMFIFYYKMIDLTKLIFLVIDQLLVIGMILHFSKPFEKIRSNNKIKEALAYKLAEVTRLKASKVIVRPDDNNVSQGYYLDIGNRKTIFLQNEHFERLYFQNKFPATGLEIIRTALNKIYVTTIISGTQLLPEKEIAPFSKEQYTTGDIHKDGQILEIPIDKIN